MLRFILGLVHIKFDLAHHFIYKKWAGSTGISFSEALILASTNPQYDKRLFIELQVQYMKIASSEHAQNIGLIKVHL